MKILQWEPSCFMRLDGRTEGRTDMRKLTVACRNLSHDELPQYSRATPRHFSSDIHYSWSKPSVDSIYRSAAIWWRYVALNSLYSALPSASAHNSKKRYSTVSSTSHCHYREHNLSIVTMANVISY